MTDHVNSYDHDAPTPDIGSRWVWEINDPRARTLIEVTEIKWNDEEWWIKTRSLPEAPTPMFADLTEPEEHLNDLSRFWEAVTPVGAPIRGEATQ